MTSATSTPKGRLPKADTPTDEPRQREPALFISVESRKGGVGKTTAALCLADLLKEDYAVLVLDLDITGTNAADVEEASFWEDKLNVVKDPRGDPPKDNPPKLNLLRLFDSHFMAGLGIPDFSIDGRADCLLVNPNRVNVVGSQIYDVTPNKSSGSGDKQSSYGQTPKATCIERPGVLFDDLHTFWLLEFVKELSLRFAGAVKDKGKRVAVILDNSPGYVGLAPAIQEWLTDLGPERGKFLTVTSLDTQDLLACDKACALLHSQFTDKWETSRLFAKAKNEKGTDEGPQLRKEQEPFFIRLMAQSFRGAEAQEELEFYSGMDVTPGTSKDFTKEPTRYMAAVINRVPPDLMESKRDHTPPEGLSQSSGIYQLLGGYPPRATAWRERMVPFDENLQRGYMTGFGIGTHRGGLLSSRTAQALRRKLSEAREELMYASSKLPSLDLAMATSENVEEFEQLAGEADRILKLARGAVAQVGLDSLVAPLPSEFFPAAIFGEVEALMEGHIWLFDRGAGKRTTPDRLLEALRRRLEELVSSLTARPSRPDCEAATQLSSTVGVLGYLSSVRFTIMRNPNQEMLVDLHAALLREEFRRWSEAVKSRLVEPGVKRFLVNAPVPTSSLRQSKSHEFLDHFPKANANARRDAIAFYRRYYGAFTSAQARLLDLAADSEFLLHLMESPVNAAAMSESSLAILLEKLGRQVIAEKILSHDEGRRELKEAVRTANYLRDFEAVLQRALRDWGVFHAKP